MSEEPKLTREEFSSVWKDGGNLKWGLHLDLINHLKTQREVPSWVALKARMLDKVLEQLPKDRPVQVVEIGCGLGIDVFDLANRLSEVNKHPGSRIIGLDFNSEMLAYCNGSHAERQSLNTLPPSSHIEIQFIKDDATKLETLANDSIDLIRSDIALQHMDPVLTLTSIKRVLKDGGSYCALEGAAGAGFYCSDELVASTYKRLIPALPDGGQGIRAFFELKKLNFNVLTNEYHGICSRGADLKTGDPGWVKIQGMGKMAVGKKMMTEEEWKEYFTRFSKACDDDALLVLGGCALLIAKKQ